MTRLEKDTYKEYKEFSDNGIDLSQTNRVVPHTSTETNAHFVGKALVARVGMSNGYRVDSEVLITENHSTDILLWGHPERLTVCVELETSPQDGVVGEKLDKYVYSNPCVQDMYLLNANNLPLDRVEAEEWVAGELGLEP